MSWIWLLGICYRIDFVYTAFFVYSISHPAFLLRLGYFYTSHLIAIKPFINPDWGSFSSQSIETETETETETEKSDAASTWMLQSRGMLEYEVIWGRAY